MPQRHIDLYSDKHIPPFCITACRYLQCKLQVWLVETNIIWLKITGRIESSRCWCVCIAAYRLISSWMCSFVNHQKRVCKTCHAILAKCYLARPSSMSLLFCFTNTQRICWPCVFEGSLVRFEAPCCDGVNPNERSPRFLHLDSN